MLKKILNRKNFVYLLYFNGLLWFVFGIWLFLSDRQNYFKGINLYDVIALLMFLNFLAFFILAYLVFKKNRWSFYLSIIWLFINLLLTFTDELGLLDIMVLLLNLFSIAVCFYLYRELRPAIDIRQKILKKNIINK